jgi:hypothetical protein
MLHVSVSHELYKEVKEVGSIGRGLLQLSQTPSNAYWRHHFDEVMYDVMALPRGFWRPIIHLG